MGEAYLIASGKGGTGKSVFAANMGAMLASGGSSVVLVDMDMGLRTLDIYMGLESKVVYNVYDVVTGLCRIGQALIRDKRFDELYLLAGAPERNDAGITQLHMKKLIDRLKGKFDYVIIDAPAGIDEGFVLAASGADKAVIVTCAEYAAVRDAEKTSQVLDRLGISDRCYVLNKVQPGMLVTGVVPSLDEVDSMLRMPLAGIIIDDRNISIASNNGLPIVFKEDSYIHDNMKKIVERITTGTGFGD